MYNDELFIIIIYVYIYIQGYKTIVPTFMIIIYII